MLWCPNKQLAKWQSASAQQISGMSLHSLFKNIRWLTTSYLWVSYHSSPAVIFFKLWGKLLNWMMFNSLTLFDVKVLNKFLILCLWEQHKRFNADLVTVNARWRALDAFPFSMQSKQNPKEDRRHHPRAPDIFSVEMVETKKGCGIAGYYYFY